MENTSTQKKDSEECVNELSQSQVTKNFAKYTSIPADTGEQLAKDTQKATLTAFNTCLGHRSLNYVGLYARLSVEYFGNNEEYDVQEADDNDKPRIRMLLAKGYNPVLNSQDGGVHYFRKAK